MPLIVLLSLIQQIDILPARSVRGFQDQAAIALEERLTSPTLREDAPSL